MKVARPKLTYAEGAWLAAFALTPIAMRLLQAAGLPSPFLLFDLAAVALLLSSFVSKSASPNANYSQIVLVGLLALLASESIAILLANDLQYSGSGKLITPLTILLYGFMAVRGFRVMAGRGRGRDVATALFLSMPLFVAMQLLITLTSDDPLLFVSRSGNSLMELVGLTYGRLATANHTGALAGAALVALFHLWVSGFRLRWLLIALTVCAVWLIALADSRGAFVSAAFCVVLYVVFGQRTLSAMARLVLIATLTAPLWLYQVFQWLDANSFDFLVRSGDLATRLGSGTGRVIVWDVAFNELANTRFEHVFGFGAGGHISAGLADRYQWLFPTDLEPHTLHSITLQTLIDQGYVGLALYAWVAWMAVGAIAKASWLAASQRRAFLCLLVYIFSTGVTEVGGTPYHFDLFILMVGIFCVATVWTAPPEAPDKVAIAEKGDKIREIARPQISLHIAEPEQETGHLSAKKAIVGAVLEKS